MFCIRNLKKKTRIKYNRIFFRLENAPQRKALVLKLLIKTPKKPNSALRHVVKVVFYKNQKKLFARIPGIGFLPTKFNRVLVRGGRANDLPSVRFTLIRNVYDFAGLYAKKKRRSFYGTPQSELFYKHVRRKLRKIYS